MMGMPEGPNLEQKLRSFLQAIFSSTARSQQPPRHGRDERTGAPGHLKPRAIPESKPREQKSAWGFFNGGGGERSAPAFLILPAAHGASRAECSRLLRRLASKRAHLKSYAVSEDTAGVLSSTLAGGVGVAGHAPSKARAALA